MTVQVGEEKSRDTTHQAAGVDVQSRPFSPPPGTAAPVPTFNPQVGFWDLFISCQTHYQKWPLGSFVPKLLQLPWVGACI